MSWEMLEMLGHSTAGIIHTTNLYTLGPQTIIIIQLSSSFSLNLYTIFSSTWQESTTNPSLVSICCFCKTLWWHNWKFPPNPLPVCFANQPLCTATNDAWPHAYLMAWETFCFGPSTASCSAFLSSLLQEISARLAPETLQTSRSVQFCLHSLPDDGLHHFIALKKIQLMFKSTFMIT